MNSTSKRVLGLLSPGFLIICANGCGGGSSGSDSGGGNTLLHGIVISDTVNRRAAYVKGMDGTGWRVATPNRSPAPIMPRRVATDSRGRIYYTQHGEAYIARIDDLTGRGFVRFGSFGSGAGQFGDPDGIAIDSADRIYIADTLNSRIVRINDMSGSGWMSYGSHGSGPGGFNAPAGIKIDTSGRIYVADARNHRIVRIDDMTGGGWATYVGSDRSQPRDIAVDPVRGIFIIDAGVDAIVHVDDLSGGGLTVYGSQGSSVGQFDDPNGIALDALGRIYVADKVNSRLVRIDNMTGAGWTALLNKSFGTGHFVGPGSVQITNAGHILTADVEKIASFADMTGTEWLAFAGVPPPSLNQPSGVALDNLHGFFLADTENNRIVYYGNVEDQKPIAIGTEGDGILHFRWPRGVAVDFLGRIYIADTGNNRIVRMDDEKGKGFVSFGTRGSGFGQFNDPTGIAVAKSGDSGVRIYVADSSNHRIARIDDMTGTGWVTLGSEGSGTRQLRVPTGIAAVVDGHVLGIYIADTLNNRIVYCKDMTGDGWTPIVGSGPSQLSSPTAISVGRLSGLIRVADQGNHRIVEFNGFAIAPTPGGPVGTFREFKTLGTFGTGERQFRNPWGVDGS